MVSRYHRHMARINVASLQQTLDLLVVEGVLRGWQARPLGIYHLFLFDGSRITPSRKETALWVMGASAVMTFKTQ